VSTGTQTKNHTKKEHISANSETPPGMARVGAAFERLRELNERLLANARKAGNEQVDWYERAVAQAIEVERKMSERSRQKWIKSLIDAQAGIAYEMASTYTAAARSMLR
jgi:hypothetical protein